jgi:hypothetical protein
MLGGGHRVVGPRVAGYATMRRHQRVDHRSSQGERGRSVEYFQSVIALETAITGVLLFQIRFFATGKDAPEASDVDPRLRVLLLVVLTATVFGSLEAIREHRGRWSAVLVTVGLAVSLLPILLRVLPPLHRGAQPSSAIRTTGSPCSASSCTR